MPEFAHILAILSFFNRSKTVVKMCWSVTVCPTKTPLCRDLQGPCYLLPVQTNSTFIIYPYLYTSSNLSFVNRSFLVVQTCNVGKICRIMPRFYATMQALCCVVPWQMNNTFIGISYLQNRIKLLQFAPVCQATETPVILRKIGPNGKNRQSVAYLGRG